MQVPLPANDGERPFTHINEQKNNRTPIPKEKPTDTSWRGMPIPRMNALSYEERPAPPPPKPSQYPPANSLWGEARRRRRKQKRHALITAIRRFIDRLRPNF